MIEASRGRIPAAMALAATLLLGGACDQLGQLTNGDSQRDDLSSNEALLRKEDYGADWPLRVDEGVVRCERPGEVYFTVDGQTYAVNTLAVGNSDFPDILSLLPRGANPSSIRVISDEGIKLC